MKAKIKRNDAFDSAKNIYEGRQFLMLLKADYLH